MKDLQTPYALLILLLSLVLGVSCRPSEQGNCADPDFTYRDSYLWGPKDFRYMKNGTVLNWRKRPGNIPVKCTIWNDSVTFFAPDATPCTTYVLSTARFIIQDADTLVAMEHIIPGVDNTLLFRNRDREVIGYESVYFDKKNDNDTFTRIYGPGDTFQVYYRASKGLLRWKNTKYGIWYDAI